MKTTMVLVLALLVAQGCNPGRQTPPPAVPPPALPPATTTQAPDDRALQTLRDLGVTPETMVQLVRNQLAALPTNAPAPNQPPPVAISEPAAPAAPATPAAPAEPPPAVEPVPNPETVSATPPPPPAAEWPNATGPNQPATVEDANTENAQPPAPAAAPVVVQQPVTIQQAQDSKMAADRKQQVGSGDRSERIRTYNFPQGRMTDHRIGLTLYRLDSIMAGDIVEITDALRAHYQMEALKAQSESN